MTRVTSPKMKELIEIEKQIKELNKKRQQISKSLYKNISYKDFKLGYTEFQRYEPPKSFKNKVMGLLKERPMFIKELAINLGVAVKTVYNYVLTMELEGLLEKKRFGNFLYYGIKRPKKPKIKHKTEER